MKAKMEEVEQMACWRKHIPCPIGYENQKCFAVVIPLIRKKGEDMVLFEVRSENLKTQPGEVCFPGGQIEPGESARQAAFRELSEELLIEQEQAEFLMASDYLINPAGLILYPFLARLRGYEGTFSQAEVERIQLVPLAWFFENEPDCYLSRIITVPDEKFPFEKIPNGEHYRWREGTYEIMFYQYGDFVIWGMTARILKACVDILKKEGFQFEGDEDSDCEPEE